MNTFRKICDVVLNYIHYVKNHQILVDADKRIFGIIYTLIGWFLLAYSMVVFQPNEAQMPQSFSFLIGFFSSVTFLYLIAKVGNISLKVTAHTDKDYKTHFGIKARKILLYIRATVAIFSYFALVYSKKSLGIVNDSALYSADALIYALLMYWILKERRSFWDWMGIFIASVGVSLPFIFNAQSNGIAISISGGLLGLASSISLSIIFFMNAVLVRHEPATRIAFYQVLVGCLFALILSLFSIQSILAYIPKITLIEIKNAVMSGLIFGLALICFFRAFLYTEIILIAVTGYTLDPISMFLENHYGHESTSLMNWMTILLIAIGTAILYIEEHRHAKKRRNVKASKPIYEQTLAQQFEENDQQFQKGAITLEAYLSKRRSFNELLFKISEEMIDTDVDKIELEQGLVYFSLFDSEIRLECDEEMQSTPLEILNLGSHWKHELKFIFDLCKGQCTVINFSAQVGWLSLNLAKNNPQSSIFAFEASIESYSLFIRNIKNNQCLNIKPFNIRLSNRNGVENFFLLPEEQVLTPEKNALIYSDLTKIESELRTIDEMVESLSIEKLHLIVGSASGNELEILQGAQSVLEKHHPIFFFELFEELCEELDFTVEDLIKYLKEKGYQGYHLNETTTHKISRKNKENPSNPHYFFFHKEKHADILKRYRSRLHKASEDLKE